jgi:hypothetical protein
VLRETELFGRHQSAEVAHKLTGNGLIAKTAFLQPLVLSRENDKGIA